MKEYEVMSYVPLVSREALGFLFEGAKKAK